MNSDIRSAKRLKLKYELVWCRDNSTINRIRYHAAVNCYNFPLEVSRRRHYSTVIAEKKGNPKAMWNIIQPQNNHQLKLQSPDQALTIFPFFECLACVQKWMDGVRLKLDP